jgi:hypothetical protein
MIHTLLFEVSLSSAVSLFFSALLLSQMTKRYHALRLLTPSLCAGRRRSSDWGRSEAFLKCDLAIPRLVVNSLPGCGMARVDRIYLCWAFPLAACSGLR